MRVMIMTHDAERRANLEVFLGTQGYDVTVPPHRHDAVPMARRTNPDAIVLDLYLVDPNGADLLHALRAGGYNGKVVALSGLGSRATLSKCWQEGVDQVVGGVHSTKGPVDAGQIEAAIRASFRRESAQRTIHL